MTAAQHSFTFDGDATISACGRYRYALTRRMLGLSSEALSRPSLCWLMLNPSTADAADDDPTIRKVMGFTRRNGYGVAIVVKLFAWRETDLREVGRRLRTGPGPSSARHEEIVGPGNRSAIMQAAAISDAVVCAWGATPWARGQAARAVGWLAAHPAKPIRLLCLGHTNSGAPLHPLMPSYDGHPLVPYTGTA